jgi:Icc-related predicted phosphoesterase
MLFFELKTFIFKKLIFFMLIAATGDIHSPHYYEEFLIALDKLVVKPDLFLMVGDIVDRGKIDEFEKVYNAIFGKINCPIISCFGNNEFPQIREELKKKFKEIKFLDDESTIVNVKGVEVGIVGSTGSLDVPTTWQKRNIPNIETIYKRRIELVDSLLLRLLPIKIRILLLHYSPTYKTLEGENPAFYGKLGTFKLEDVLISRSPELVIHGHSHRGKKFTWVDKVPVFNVAFPLNKEIVVIDTENLKPGLAKFV